MVSKPINSHRTARSDDCTSFRDDEEECLVASGDCLIDEEHVRLNAQIPRKWAVDFYLKSLVASGTKLKIRQEKNLEQHPTLTQMASCYARA